MCVIRIQQITHLGNQFNFISRRIKSSCKRATWGPKLLVIYYIYSSKSKISASIFCSDKKRLVGGFPAKDGVIMEANIFVCH